MVVAVCITLVVMLVSMVVVIVIVSVAVSMAVLVSAGSVAVPATGELEPGEDETGEDQDRADDRVLGVFDRGSKLQADDDDDGTEDERDEDVCDAGEGGEPGDLPRFGAKAAAKRKRPVFIYMISGAKVRAPAAATGLIERIS